MNNLEFLSQRTFSDISFTDISKTHYDVSTNTFLILNHHSQIFFLKYNPKSYQIQQINHYKIIEIENETPIFLSFLVENSSALIFTEEGTILTLDDTNGDVQVQAQNQDGISGGSLSPAQDYIYVITKNNTIVMLDAEFDLIKEIMLDQDNLDNQEKCDSYNPRFTWKQDGTFLAINILTDKGRKCHTRDNQLGLFRSPAKSDPESDGLVQSVSQKSWPDMGHCCAWQPSGGLIAGNDFINKNGKKVNRVIFWQKNTLRHLEFELPETITDILELNWSPDSQILCVEAQNLLSQRLLLMYHRQNYYWYLKYTYRIAENSHYFLLKHTPSSSPINELVLFHFEPVPKIQVLTYKLKYSNSSFLSQNKQSEINACSLFFNIDFNKLFITNFGKALIPPPMSEIQYLLDEGWILGVQSYDNYLVIIGSEAVILYDYNTKNARKYKYLSNNDVPAPLINLQVHQINPLKFSVSNWMYESSEQQVVIRSQFEGGQQSLEYTHYNCQTMTQVTISPYLNDHLELQLHSDELIKISKTCTSFTIYHEFLIFTCTSNQMYDKLFVFDLELDQWLFGENGRDSCADQSTISHKLEEIQQKKELNYRTIERGSRILGVSKNRLIFQLPRGNLEGVFPKIIMIKWVKKCIKKKAFKEAFETIRTHKLDLNLLYDLSPTQFAENSKQILLHIKKPDYINLFVSQVKDVISSQLRYCLSPTQIDEIQTYIAVKLQNKKIKQVCRIVSETLREADQDKYILSIFTAEIKMGLLQQVLFQIKSMKKDDIETVIPPHILSEEEKLVNKKPKKLTSQQILEYVCWLVDVNVIYEASLLTYDIQLASITARCTQMDPKEYIPYLQELKDMENQIEFKKKICLDLKKYEKAIEVLAESSDDRYKQQAVELVQKHQLFKVGLRVFKRSKKQSEQQKQINEKWLIKVKMIIVEHLLSLSEHNEAYNILIACGKYQRALQIAINMADGNKIKRALESIPEMSEAQRVERVKEIIAQLGDTFKNKSDIGILYSYIGDNQNSALSYLKDSNYQKAYQLLPKLSKTFINTQYTSNMELIYSLFKNLLLKDKSMMIQKTNRLQKVHKLKKIQGISFTNRNQLEEDMYSEISMSSRAGSSSAYTISTTTGMRKKKDKKRSILTRNVKEGSPLQEEYLITFINDLKSRAQNNIKQSKMLIQHLIYMNLIEQAENLRDIARQYGQILSSKPPKYYVQLKFEEQHPETGLLFGNENQSSKDSKQPKPLSVDSFNYLF